MTGRKTPWTVAAVGMAVLKALPAALFVQIGVTTLMTGPGTYLWDTDADAQSIPDLLLLVVAGTLMLAGALIVAASVLRLGGWMIGLGIAIMFVGTWLFTFSMEGPSLPGLVLMFTGFVLMIIGMERSWHAQRSDPTMLVEANGPVPSS